MDNYLVIIEKGYAVPEASANFYYSDNESSNGVINFRCAKSLHKKLLWLAKKRISLYRIYLIIC